MKNIFTLMLAVVLFAACQSTKTSSNNQPDTNDGTTASQTDTNRANQLTAAEKNAGWKLLFNGEDMDGWRTYKNRENDSWEVVNGTLHCKAEDAAKKRADILTTQQYGDFELVFDWKIAPGDNSGVIYRATEEYDQPYLSGPEYQVIDDKNYSGDLTATQTSASNYDMHAAPEDKTINPPGEWNTGKIVARGNHVEHWLNGKKLIEYEIGSEKWKTLKAGSKWKDAEGYGMAERGHIDLQDHGGEVWYRNIRIKTL